MVKADSVSEKAQRILLFSLQNIPFVLIELKVPDGKEQGTGSKETTATFIFNHHADAFEFLLSVGIFPQNVETFLIRCFRM